MFFQFTEYWRNNIDRPLNIFNITEVLIKKLEHIGSALIDFQSRWLRICDWESRFSIRLKCKNTLKIKFMSGCVKPKSKSESTGLKSKSQKMGLESKSWTRVLHLCQTSSLVALGLQSVQWSTDVICNKSQKRNEFIYFLANWCSMEYKEIHIPPFCICLTQKKRLS